MMGLSSLIITLNILMITIGATIVYDLYVVLLSNRHTVDVFYDVVVFDSYVLGLGGRTHRIPIVFRKIRCACPAEYTDIFTAFGTVI